MQVVLNTNFGPRAVTIQKVGMSVVDVDLNHPMAGKDLHFDIEVVDVREASQEEVEHGHVPGDGGHEHGRTTPPKGGATRGALTPRRTRPTTHRGAHMTWMAPERSRRR